MQKHTKRQVKVNLKKACVYIWCLSPLFVCYFLSNWDGQRKRVFIALLLWIIFRWNPIQSYRRFICSSKEISLFWLFSVLICTNASPTYRTHEITSWTCDQLNSQHSQRDCSDTWTNQWKVLEEWHHLFKQQKKGNFAILSFFLSLFSFKIITYVRKNIERFSLGYFFTVVLSFCVNSPFQAKQM